MATNARQGKFYSSLKKYNSIFNEKLLNKNQLIFYSNNLGY